jgi:hypothetical protein
MDVNIIRSIIFFVFGVVLILFPKRIYEFQVYVFKKLHIKYDEKTHKNYNSYYGIILIIISIILLGVVIY